MKQRKTQFSVLSSKILDRLFGDYFDSKRVVIMGNPFAQGTPPPLDNANPAKLDNTLLRNLYRNTDQRYAMSAHLVKPVVDLNKAFIGTPTIRSSNARTLKAIDSFAKDIPFSIVHKIAEREGVAYVWPQMREDGTVRFEVLRPETVDHICIDPITKEVVAYIIDDEFSYMTKDGNSHTIHTVTTIDAQVMKTVITSDNPNLQGTKVVKNIFGFIPVIAFLNDAEPWELRGHSEIENIEPQLKWYNDTTVEAGRAQKRDGHPKLLAKVDDVEQFINTNFGAGAFARLQGGESVDLAGKDFLIVGNENDKHKEETVSYIEANKTTGEYNNMAEKSFTNIIEGAQTPEINLGANMGTSLASVKEQRPAYIKKIQAKQKQYEESWKRVITATLMILGISTFRTFEDTFTFSWPTPDFASEQEKASTLNTLSTAMIKMKEAYLMSDKEIYDTLKALDILKMEQKQVEHDAQVDATAKKMAEREPDKKAQADNDMNQRIANGKYDNTKPNDDDADKGVEDGNKK